MLWMVAVVVFGTVMELVVVLGEVAVKVEIVEDADRLLMRMELALHAEPEIPVIFDRHHHYWNLRMMW
jgi:hypothetical protein